MATRFLLLLCLISVFLSCKKYHGTSESELQDWYSGGGQTTFVSGAGAYGQPFPTLSGNILLMHGVGDKAFEATFVTAPAPVNSGLGPLFNNVSCVSCHIGDGRGAPPNAGGPLTSMLIRTSIAGTDAHGGPLGAPGFGGQFQQKAVFGVTSEGDILVTYGYQTYTFSDGTPYELRTPYIQVNNPYMATPAGMMVSARIAPPVFGLGLLEAISTSSLLAHEDPNDSNGDGISGRANWVWNVMENKNTIGRFGWKASAPSLIQQIAAAYNQDMGITNFIFPEESSYGQLQYDYLLDDVELSDSLLYATTIYMQTLAVPARRNVQDPKVIRGKEVFTEALCVKCHVPSYRTAVNVAFPEVSNQLIFPYTDLLLHDMGPGLADNRPDYLATGTEWKTPPLWGIGLTEVVNGHSYFLHDGRARTLLEAIMWHGGEAETAKNKVVQLSTNDRNALIAFLKSL